MVTKKTDRKQEARISHPFTCIDPDNSCLIRRRAWASGWVQTRSGEKDILPGLIEALFDCSVNQEMAFKARGRKSRIDFKLGGSFHRTGFVILLCLSPRIFVSMTRLWSWICWICISHLYP